MKISGTFTAVFAATIIFPFCVTVNTFAASKPVVEAPLYNFQGASNNGDGAEPDADLINMSGTFYGTTSGGGASGDGTVFSMILRGEGVETVIYSFQGGSDGEMPQAGLINVNGTLYGTTQGGGAGGYGTVFSVTPAGAETVLHSFQGGSDGAFPLAGLIKVGGRLYGTTSGGGASGDGTVFSISMRKGVETVVYSFQGGSDGANPASKLTNVHGTLYGTTEGGGGYGTVFSVTPAGAETVLHSFQGGFSDGAFPLAGLINVSGTFYGTTYEGGAGNYGTVFSVTPAGVETLLYSFQGFSDGAFPQAGLINVDGTLYGTTQSGGSNSYGTVFLITPGLNFDVVVHSFAGHGVCDGAFPQAGLINVDGTLYGTTSSGGCDNYGTVFSLQ